MNESITRRSLFAAGAGFAACAVGGALAAPARAAEVPAWDYEADVVICGFGMAGIGAALAATDAGCSVLLLEKMDEENAGGSLASCGGGVLHATADSIRTNSYHRYSDEFYDKMAERANMGVQWFIDHDPEGSTMGAEDAISYTANPVGGGYHIYKTVAPQITALEGVQVEYEMPARELILDEETGEVRGVWAERDGQRYAVKANRGVLLSTGGFAEDSELMRAAGYKGGLYANGGSPAATGDGLKMALAAGARLGDFANSAAVHISGLRKMSEKLGTTVMLEGDAPNGAIYVNVKGQRYTDETLLNWGNQDIRMLVKNRDGGHLNMPTWALFDADMFAGPSIVHTGVTCWAHSHIGVDWGENASHGEEDGVLSAETLEELAGKMVATNAFGDEVACSPEGVAETVAAYNADVEAGVDSQFGRAADSMVALKTPPFYAVELIPNVLFTIGGVDTDEQSRVLGFDGQPIPRLYAAGDIGHGTVLGTIGNSGAFARGNIAGEEISALEVWA